MEPEKNAKIFLSMLVYLILRHICKLEIELYDRVSEMKL